MNIMEVNKNIDEINLLKQKENSSLQNKFFNYKFILFISSFIIIVIVIILLILNNNNYNNSTTKVPSYQLWCVGNCNNPKITNTEPGVVLMGGGTDVDEAFLWQIKNANGGDFLILRASGSDGYNSWVYNLSTYYDFPLNSVTTILFNTIDASTNNIVLSNIKNAAAIFFAGGDQFDYITLWTNTPVQSIIQDKLKYISIGGTSAGCAILGNWIFTAQNDSALSHEAMANPYGPKMLIGPALWKIPFMEQIITDTHFVTRNRMGRMLTFVSRIIQDNGTEVGLREDLYLTSSIFQNTYGLGVDEKTALLLNISTGVVNVVGHNTAYICSPHHLPELCTNEQPLTMSNISCIRLSALETSQYYLSNFSGSGSRYCNNIINGVINSNHYGPNSNETHGVDDDRYGYYSYGDNDVFDDDDKMKISFSCL